MIEVLWRRLCSIYVCADYLMCNIFSKNSYLQQLQHGTNFFNIEAFDIFFNFPVEHYRQVCVMLTIFNES